MKLLPQVPPHEFGVAVGPGVPVGVDVGVPVGEPLGVAVGVAAFKVNERLQVAGAGVGEGSCARGILDGTFGATEVCLSW